MRYWIDVIACAGAPSSPTATSASASSTGTDRREQAQEHLTTATAMYREMGMAYWLEKAEAEMQELACGWAALAEP